MTLSSYPEAAMADYFSPTDTEAIRTHSLPMLGDPLPRFADSEDDGATSHCIVSPRGLFRVFNYHSFEGHGGVPITVALHFTFRPSETTYLRLCIGRRALNTTVRQIHKLSMWELEAVIPHVDDEPHDNPVVPITAQALTTTNGVIDAVTVGNYTYWLPGRPSLASLNGRHTERSGLPGLPGAHPSRSHSCPGGTLPRASSYSPGPVHAQVRSRPASSRANSARVRPAKVAAVRHCRKQALMRTRRFAPGEEAPESHRAVLEILTPLDSMCTGWDEEELRIGRRLVRFSRAQEGYRLRLTCECIHQDEYVEGDAVISCIYRRETDSCFVTSVDIISLLEGIVGETFEIEEKNRIRRNLEGFRPKTVSKNRAGSESFFQQIMDFPSPKPRNIEKDVKVFEWSVLPQALEKIISKYSLYYTSDTPHSEPEMSPGVDFPLEHSSTDSVCNSPTDTGDDTFVYNAPGYPYDRPYGSLADHSLPGLPPLSAGSDSSHSAFHPVYRLMPPSTASSMSDNASSIFPTAEPRSYFEDRMRSPIPYF